MDLINQVTLSNQFLVFPPPAALAYQIQFKRNSASPQEGSGSDQGWLVLMVFETRYHPQSQSAALDVGSMIRAIVAETCEVDSVIDGVQVPRRNTKALPYAFCHVVTAANDL